MSLEFLREKLGCSEYELWLDDVEIYFVDEKRKSANDKKLPMYG
ncbi:MAG: hypothetical protein QW743_05720 [Candidatus Methanomethylicia archaeon]